MYDSVIKAWTQSLKVFEQLVDGVSQTIDEGGPLLALLSWHLYPDLVVLDPVVANIQQKDSLLWNSGAITIGTHKTSNQPGDLLSSLPLAYLRHYGTPVVHEGSIHDSRRLTLPEFLYALLGSFIETAGGLPQDPLQTIQWLDNLHRILGMESENGLREANTLLDSCNEGNWLGLLFLASIRYRSTSGSDEVNAMALIQLGRRHGKQFLHVPDEPLLGIATNGEYVSLTENPDDRVQMLRDFAENLPGEDDEYIIRLKHRCQDQTLEILSGQPQSLSKIQLRKESGMKI